jgi:hypothetical protein
MMMYSGGSKPVAMAIQGVAVRGVGPLSKELVSNNIRSKHGCNKREEAGEKSLCRKISLLLCRFLKRDEL